MDDLDALLTPDPVPPEPPGLRQAVERAAGRVLRRRRWLGRTRWAAALAACYAAGVATTWLWSHAPRPAQPVVVEHVPPQPSPVPPEPTPPADADPYRGSPP